MMEVYMMQGFVYSFVGAWLGFRLREWEEGRSGYDEAQR